MPLEGSSVPAESAGLAPLLLDAVSSKTAIVSIILSTIAILLVTISFWKLAVSSSDMLRITDYATVVAPGQQRTFGYGGIEKAPDQGTVVYRGVDVPFQSPTMSSVCFEIGRGDDGKYWIKGVQDRIQVSGEIFDANKEIQLANKTRFKTVGEYGGAVFTAFLDEEPREVRLHLESPIYYKLTSRQTRVTFGTTSEIVKSPVDEVLVRTVLRDRPSETVLIDKKPETADFAVGVEADLAVAPNPKSEVLDALRGSNPVDNTGQALLDSKSSKPVGTALILFTRQSPSALGGVNAAKFFGFKFLLIVVLLAVALGLQGFGLANTQVRLPSGPIIFGSVALFAAVGLSLTARDYFQPPFNQERFSSYSHYFFYGIVILSLIRIPLQSFWNFKWLVVYPVLLFVYILLFQPFDGLVSLPSFSLILTVSIAYVALAFFVHYAMRFFLWFTETALSGDLIRVLLFVFIPVIAIDIFTRLMGGREAFHFGAFRVHLPTLFLPLIVFGTSLAVVTAEKIDTGWLKQRSYALAFILIVILFYYFLSGGDHGGAAVLGFGVFAAMWAASRKSHPWIFSALLLILLVTVTYIATVYFEHQRLALAWGGDEGLLKYFDQAVNLRTARDMARAGGWFGLYDKLYVPSTVSMNVYNDLVTAYIAGFFGLLGIVVVLSAYFVFYSRILKGIRELTPRTAHVDDTVPKSASALKRGQFSPVAVKPTQDIETPGSQDDLIRVLVAYALGMIGAFLFQFLWVFTATLWRRLPFTGLDLQPISASVISILSFIISLLGSVVVVRNLYQFKNRSLISDSSANVAQSATRIPRRGELIS